jgi:hypothetical protein
LGTHSSIAGNSSANLTYNLREEGGQVILDWRFDDARDGASNSYADSFGHLIFTVDADTAYDLSGVYTLDGGSRVYQRVYLHDITAGEYAAFSYNESYATENQVLQVGQASGGINNVFGSTTGTLVAGHRYEFGYEYLIHAYPNADSGATALGQLNLTLGAPALSAVPEPATLTLWGLGALGCAAVRYRRRKPAA